MRTLFTLGLITFFSIHSLAQDFALRDKLRTFSDFPVLPKKSKSKPSQFLVMGMPERDKFSVLKFKDRRDKNRPFQETPDWRD